MTSQQNRLCGARRCFCPFQKLTGEPLEVASEIEEFKATPEALLQELDRATLVDSEKLPAGTVTMNSLVHFKNEGNDVEY